VDVSTITDTTADEALLRIEVPANRYDLLSVEGLVLALRVFIGADPALPRFTAAPPQTRMVVHREVLDVRPVVVCAVIRGIHYTPKSFASFIDLQVRAKESTQALQVPALHTDPLSFTGQTASNHREETLVGVDRDARSGPRAFAVQLRGARSAGHQVCAAAWHRRR
jgi:hypothetical protein